MRSPSLLAALAALAACKPTPAATTASPSAPSGAVTPEQATQALLDGDDGARFIDATIGVVDFPGTPVCGDAVGAAVRSTVAAMQADLAGGATLTCATDELADPGGTAACTTSPDMEGDEGHGVRFVVDPARGLRLAGLEVYEAGTGGTDAYEQMFDAYIAAIAGRAPCR